MIVPLHAIWDEEKVCGEGIKRLEMKVERNPLPEKTKRVIIEDQCTKNYGRSKSFVYLSLAVI